MPVSYTPAGLFNQDCMACLQAKAANGDADAQIALHYIACMSEFLACRMLTGKPNDPCQQKSVRKIPPNIANKFQNFDCTQSQGPGGVSYAVSGFTSSVIEDPDWDRRGNRP